MKPNPPKSTDAERFRTVAIVDGDDSDPFSFLGMHTDEADGVLIVRAFLPWASRVAVIPDDDPATHHELVKTHEAGFFAGRLGTKKRRFAYRLLVATTSGEMEIDDPYRFPPALDEDDLRKLAEGDFPKAYEILGAHFAELDGVAGVRFAVWAPNAKRVSVIGSFNDWDGRRLPMRARGSSGIWEHFVPGLAEGDLYKYEIKSRAGRILPAKTDPYAFLQERPPSTAAVICDPRENAAHREGWSERIAKSNERGSPISIYEVHLGSWKRRAEEGDRYLSYRELADELVPYVKDMGFTHIELLPISEHPFDGSWGYQPLGLFAPTSRFGGPRDFHAFVDRCHQEGLALILDWVPGHFPSDVHGLGYFDGTNLYEYEDPRKGRHKDWDTLIYDYGRPEVVNFLISNALFWIDRYDVDGLRVDAVASMLYLDYSREPGEWVPNQFGGNENLEAVAFLKRMNETVYGQKNGVMTAAEESTAWPMVSRPTYLGGLGFGYKWNMGWMHDTLEFMTRDAIHRRFHHNNMTFGLIYAFSENFILPLSHDEVVHGKGSLFTKMSGDRWQKFANLRAYFAFMYTHPGKKLLFMGGEFAQEREWNHDRSLDWELLDDASHRGVQNLIRDLNSIYRALPALHELDCEPEGFEWIDANDSEQSVLSYLRRGRDPDDFVVVVCNFTPVVREGYCVGVPNDGLYEERLNTDAEAYGGSNVGNWGTIRAEPHAMHGRPYSLSLTLPPLATIVLASRRQ